MTILSFLASWLPPVLWCGLIFYFSSIPGLNSGFGVWDLILRKIAHIVEFGILAALFWRAFRRTWTALTPAGLAALSGFFSLLYAASDEFHQSFVPQRGPSVQDVAVDAVGIAVSLWLLFRCRSRRAGKVLMTARNLVAFAAVLALAGCGPNAALKRARQAESKGRAYDAWTRYQNFAARYPRHDAAPEALFRAGRLAQTQLSDCSVARAFFSRVQKDYASASPWAALAGFHAENCPDYFPLVPGAKWVEGDSESGGKNARIEVAARASSGTATIPLSSGLLARDYFGGTSKFRTTEVLYRKDGATVWEHDAGAPPRVVLKGPFEPGTSWTSEIGGRRYVYEVMSATRTISVAAGTFEDCLWVRSRSEGIPGATDEFFAPGVGKVLTSFATAAGEKRNTELLSYTPGQEKPQQ